MGKKNKEKKKGQGKEKTQQKTDKKASKRSKKELAEKGEDDIERLIAEFQEQDKKKTQVLEEKCEPPSARCNMTLTPHPDKDELIMYGGEYFTGNKIYLYSDLLFYNIRKNEWLKVTAPNGPAPRSSHQAVSLKQGGGQLWIFGGEFASPTQSQFYHYKELWVYHIREKRWEKVSAPGGPSARSGHRMVQCKKQLIVFGGFHDNIRDYKYYNDIYAFNLDTYTWTQIVATGVPPPPRSGCMMAAMQETGRVVIYGGYSKERVKRDVDVGKVHTDMVALVPEGKVKDDVQPTKWKWVQQKQSGSRPSPRSGVSLAVVGVNKAVCFGGVFDEEENEEQIKGKFYNNMFLIELDKGKWFDVELRGKRTTEKKKRRKKKDGAGDDGEEGEEEEDEEDEDEEKMDVAEDEIKKLSIDSATVQANSEKSNMDTNVAGEATGATSGEATLADSGEGTPMEAEFTGEASEESVFKVTIGPQSSASSADGVSGSSGAEYIEVFMPSPRMNTAMAMKNGQLFMYGGIFEAGDRQYTLSDFYSIDTHKLDQWNIIIENDLKSSVWEESDSSSDEDDDEMTEGACGGEDNDSDDDDDDDDEMDIDFSDAPERPATEAIKDYFDRTKDYWISKAGEYCKSEDMKLSDKKLEKLAKEMCQESFG